MVTIYSTGTQYLANELTLTRGSVADITYVGVYHNVNPAIVPTVAQFTQVTLVKPGDSLAEGTKIDVMSLVGPRAGQVSLAPGDYQRWVLVKTATEDIIQPVDVVTIK
jgi:hypothetical protein